jgi:hypothetical protein
MTDLVVPGSGWTIPGGCYVPKSGTTIKPEAGATDVVVTGGLYLPPDVVDVTVEPGLIFRPGSEFSSRRHHHERRGRALFNGGSLIQWCSPRAAWYGSEIDCRMLPIQGVQVLQYSASSPRPSGEFIDGVVRNVALAPGDTTVGYDHAFYLRDASGFVIENTLLDEIRGGGALHFYPNAQGCRASRCTARHPFAAVYFWGSATTGNVVDGLLILDQEGRPEQDGIVRGGGEHGNTLDYRTTPTPGYGCEETPPPEPGPDNELVERVAALEAFQGRVEDWIAAGQDVLG